MPSCSLSSATAKVRRGETLELHLQRRSFEALAEQAEQEVRSWGPMTVAHQFRDGMTCRINILLQNTIFRYLFGIAAVAGVFALIGLIPWTGTGAPVVLFFGAVLVTSLFAGVGPAICAVLLSLPFSAYTFVTGAGSSVVQASFQSLLFAVDGKSSSI